ncbi:MAG: oxygenase MpaB family protein [Myxococcota bacterium]
MVVERPDLERWLAELRAGCPDARAGLFGPGSSMWTVSRESVLFLGGGRAALLQLAHPYVATAVKHFSTSEKDLAGRFQRTFLHVFAMVFGDLDMALGSARRVFGLHKTIGGALEEPHGHMPRGHRYEANDEAALMWVHATLVDTAVLMYERCVKRLSDAEREAHYQDTKTFARLFGISDRVLPADWPAFRRYFDGVVASDLLTVGEAGRRMGTFLLTPPNAAVRPMWQWYASVTAGLLPERVREGFGMRWGRRDRALSAATLATLSATWRLLPGRVRYVPAYLDALRRMRGETTRDPIGQVAEKIVLTALRQE